MLVNIHFQKYNHYKFFYFVQSSEDEVTLWLAPSWTGFEHARMQVIPDSLFSRLNSRAEIREFRDCRATLLKETIRIMIIEIDEPWH